MSNLVNYTDQTPAKPSGSKDTKVIKKGAIIFGTGERDYGPSNPDLTDVTNTGYFNCFFATGSGSFSFFEIPTKIITENFTGGIYSTNTSNANPSTDRVATFPAGAGGNPILTEVVIGELNSTVSASLALARKDDSPLVINLEQTQGGASGSYRVTNASLIHTDKTKLEVSTIWAGDTLFETGGGPVTFTFITSSVEGEIPDQMSTHISENRVDFMDFYVKRSPYFQTTASTLQHVLDEVAEDDTAAIVASTDFDDYVLDVGISAGVNYEAIKRTDSPSALGEFVRFYGQNSPFTSSAACDWVCLKGGITAEVGRPYGNTVLKQINPSDNTITSALTANSSPNQVTTSTLTLGRIYQSSKPISLQNQADHSSIANLNYKGEVLGWKADRYFNHTIRIFCLEDGTSVNLYKNGISADKFISNHTGDYGDIITITLTEADWDEQFAFFKSNKDIVGTTDGNTGDNFQLPVATRGNTPMYRTRNPGDSWQMALDGTQPDTDNVYAIADPVGCVTILRGDGNGGDSEGGVSTDFLTNTYAFGQGKLTNYTIVSGYNQTITVSYYDGGWTQYDTHTMTGATITNPVAHEEGDPGASPTVPLVDITTVWKFEADNPFFLSTNDGSADEEIHIGWNRLQPNILISY
jgi:hypothetical protein